MWNLFGVGVVDAVLLILGFHANHDEQAVLARDKVRSG